MKKQVAIFFLISLVLKSTLFGLDMGDYTLEISKYYDSFRGIPDGSWNGNHGALLVVNGNLSLENFRFQLGGSYGAYNWDGRGNVVFANSKCVQHIGFLTAGLSASYGEWKAGLVYDRLWSSHFGIYDCSPSIDQLRGQLGYTFCAEEVGVWTTVGLTKAHEKALGLPITFRAIGQVNLFWKHVFENCAETTTWIGLPYQNSLKFPHGRAGNFISGFSFKAPLTQSFFLEGNGAYMAARSAHGVEQSRNYGFGISLGLTYVWGRECERLEQSYLPVANHSNFFVDTNLNQ